MGGIREFEHSAIKQLSPVYVFAIHGFRFITFTSRFSREICVTRARDARDIALGKHVRIKKIDRTLSVVSVERLYKASVVSNKNIESLLAETCGGEPVEIRMQFAKLVNSISY